MTIVYFATYRGRPADAEKFVDWYRQGPAKELTKVPGVETIDLYTSDESNDPYLDDGPGPLLMLRMHFPTVEVLEAALASEVMRRAVHDLEGAPVPDYELTHDALAHEAMPVAEETEPSAHKAPVSYVVRYHRPAPDEPGFVEHYRDNHPPILGEFPEIRNVHLHTPIEWNDPTGSPRADYLLGNEVVFDSIEALNAALASDVRHRLRDDYKTFPQHDGDVTHYAMHRTRIWP